MCIVLPPLSTQRSFCQGATPAASAPGAVNTLPQQASASISGVATDSTGAVVAGARVTLTGNALAEPRVTTSGSDGGFSFAGVPAGISKLIVVAQGFARWEAPAILLSPDEAYVVPQVALKVAVASINVSVVVTQQELAQEQIQTEEKQRVFGIFPNIYTSFGPKTDTLTTKQKFAFAWKFSVDPGAFLGTGVVAGIQQWQNDFSGYGQGTEGYAKRYGAVYANRFIGKMIDGAILPSLLHQDPRYFYKGTGSIGSRALYAIEFTVRCKGDDGRWEPNYSNILGNLAAGGISNLYYPATNRNGAGVTIDNVLIGTATGAFGNLVREFVLRKLTTHVPYHGTGTAP